MKFCRPPGIMDVAETIAHMARWFGPSTDQWINIVVCLCRLPPSIPPHKNA